MAPFYAGIGAWRVHDEPGLIDQLERARRLGADGFVCFHYNDLDFTDYRMPALRLSHTARRTAPPHAAPRVSFDLPPGLEGPPGLAYAEDADISVLAAMTSESNYARQVRRASGRLVVESTEGAEVRRFGRVRADGRQPLKATFRLPPGRYRLKLEGRASFGWFSGRRFVVRSRPFEILSGEALAAEAAKLAPPRFTRGGLRVGVAVGGYGSSALLDALRKAPGIDAMRLYRLTPEFLAACQAVVLPQPRQAGATTPEVVEALRRFVAGGGGLLATHDAPGYRAHPALIPEVCRGGTDRIEGTTWQAARRHPATSGLALGRAAPHSYYDFIALAPGPSGQAVAEGLAKDARRRAPVLVCGNLASGRYAACGLALGLATGDKEAEPSGRELRLFLNTVRWLAGN
jgi:hypothetical protein